MNEQGENNLKIRFRLPNGEEFEAQGPREFIERERNYFLALIGSQQQHPATVNKSSGSLVAPDTNLNKFTQAAGNLPQHFQSYLWERLFKEDNTTLILRQKAKLPAPELALLILAGARVLLQKPAYPALELARSLKACGVVDAGRLDRLLAPEIQAGRLIGEGSKRSRTYKLTDEGFAKAFVLAEKLLQ